MSKRGYILIPDEVMERPDLTPGHKLLMGEIGRLQGDNGMCYPSLAYLAKATGISRVQVQRLIADLGKRKEIVVVHHPRQASTYSVPWATARALRKKWARQRQEEAVRKPQGAA